MATTRVQCEECGKGVIPYKGTANPRSHKNHDGENCAGGGHAPKKRVSARTKANRKNGKLGGRPRKANYEAVFEKLEGPPVDPLALCTWVQRIAARALYETIQGRGNKSMNAEIRAYAKTVYGGVPRTILDKAASLIRDDAKASGGKRNQPRGGKLQRRPVQSKPLR